MGINFNTVDDIGYLLFFIKTSIIVNQIKIFVGDYEMNDYRHKYAYS